MKKFIAFILIFSMFLFVGCGEQSGENTDYGFTDPKTGNEYVFCKPMGLYPVSHGEEYLTVKNEDKTETIYYAVEFEDTSRFLCYDENGYYFLAYNKNMEEPKLADFNPIAASIYNSANTGYITSFWADNEYLPDDLKEHNPTEDTWLCKLIAEHLTTGEHVEVPVTEDTMTDLYYIRLLSEDYPGLYYLVSFFGYNGRYFLRDGAARKTVYCPRDVILRMVGE